MYVLFKNFYEQRVYAGDIHNEHTGFLSTVLGKKLSSICNKKYQQTMYTRTNLKNRL